MLISEFFPNPIGKDTEGEWIKLFNNSQEVVNLNGWQIKDASGKTFTFKNLTVNPREYLTLNYETTKISLNNNGETLFLYDSQGELVDEAEFSGTAPEGQSLSRQNNGHFIFSGQLNPASQSDSETIQAAHSQNQLASLVSDNSLADSSKKINSKINVGNLLIGVFLALVLASLFFVIFKRLDSEQK